MARLYDQISSEAPASLVRELADEKRALAELLQQKRSASDSGGESARKPAGMMLGADTTGLKVETAIKLQPVPTGIYHLLDPDLDPLVTVTITNLSNEPRRLCVTAYIEGISARAIKTIEFKRTDARHPKVVSLLPSLLPEQLRHITEIQRATLHVVVEIFGSSINPQTRADNWSSLVESHDTHSVILLSRNSGFNAASRPRNGLPARPDSVLWCLGHAECRIGAGTRASCRAAECPTAGSPVIKADRTPKPSPAGPRTLRNTQGGRDLLCRLGDRLWRRRRPVHPAHAAAERVAAYKECQLHRRHGADGKLARGCVAPSGDRAGARACARRLGNVGRRRRVGISGNHDDRLGRLRSRSPACAGLVGHFSAEDLPSGGGPLLRVLKLNDLRPQGVWPME